MKRIVLVVLVVLLWALGSRGHAEPPPAAAENLGMRDAGQRRQSELQRREPGIDEGRRAALRHAGLHRRPARAWARRARLSGLVPALSLRAQRSTAHDEGLSRSSTGTERLDAGSDEDLGMELRAVWRLDRLVFSDVEIRALQTERALQRERATLLERVTSIYFQRRKLQLQAIHAPTTDRLKAAVHALAIAELTAALDTLTGGAFSRALRARDRPQGRPRSASAR